MTGRIPVTNSHSTSLALTRPALKRLAALSSLFFIPMPSFSSPWLEATDPFLRSDVVLLSDAGLLNSSVNHYPLRWATIGDDLSRSTYNNIELERANAHVGYALNSAKYLRGNRAAKAILGTHDPKLNSFGQFNQKKWGAYASYESLEDSFAFRVSTGYANHTGESQFVWDDSYLSLNAGKWLFSVGDLDRWWGQGWQHNLILGSNIASSPDFSISYISSNDYLGGWSVESIIGFTDDSDYERYTASRFTSKPSRWLDIGLTHQTWFDGANLGSGEQQSALDLKFSLPEMNRMYHSVYTELASTSKTTKLGAYLYGWTGQIDLFDQTWRLVLEKQNSTKDKIESGDSHWQRNSYPSSHNNQMRNTYTLDSSVSVSLYVQLENDHKLGLVVQNSKQDQQQRRTSQLSYRLPVFAGMVHAGVGYSQNDERESQTSFWTGYEFRF
ncbi:capsule assembly Wzi family protein [Vibrio nigripulchritudo]|uniref:capsule assembly Wzi family protein n=1 Tax=Vibrio nigripulchritudo TaxID=28173 RepID=UPI000697578A|nr:capsule assembly Wzi family protein [Vibrio nigripulchritudo]